MQIFLFSKNLRHGTFLDQTTKKQRFFVPKHQKTTHSGIKTTKITMKLVLNSLLLPRGLKGRAVALKILMQSSMVSVLSTNEAIV